VKTLPGRVGCISWSVTDWPDCALQAKLWHQIRPLRPALTETRLVHSWKHFSLVSGTRWVSTLNLQSQSSFFVFRPDMTFHWRQMCLKSHVRLCNYCLCWSLQLWDAIDIWKAKQTRLSLSPPPPQKNSRFFHKYICTNNSSFFPFPFFFSNLIQSFIPKCDRWTLWAKFWLAAYIYKGEVGHGKRVFEMEILSQLQPQQCCSVPCFVCFFPSSAKPGSLLLVQRRSVNFPEFPVLLLIRLTDVANCQILYSMSLSRSWVSKKRLFFSDFPSLGASSRIQGTQTK